MPISRELQYLHIEQLELDDQNPRLRRDKRREGLSQDELLKEMSAWNLDELVDSFQQAGGFWTQDAMIVVRDGDLPDGRPKFRVIEGNRRLAAIKLLWGSLHKGVEPPRWLRERLESFRPPEDDPIFTGLPTLEASNRDDVAAYLGFRHVTGIKEWRPVEKAEFIADLIDEDNLSYRDVAKKIGSRSDSVRQHYIAFKMLLQMEQSGDFDWEEVEERFSLLLLSIRSAGTREFLGVELAGDRPAATPPIPEEKTGEAKSFAKWLFGDDDTGPIVKDSRQIDKFGEILASEKATGYLRSAEAPDFQTAYSLTSANDILFEAFDNGFRALSIAQSELLGRELDGEVIDRAWPVIDRAVNIAKATGPNADRVKELILA
jgi:hypothetical protein